MQHRPWNHGWMEGSVRWRPEPITNWVRSGEERLYDWTPHPSNIHSSPAGNVISGALIDWSFSQVQRVYCSRVPSVIAEFRRFFKLFGKSIVCLNRRLRLDDEAVPASDFVTTRRQGSVLVMSLTSIAVPLIHSDSILLSCRDFGPYVWWPGRPVTAELQKWRTKPSSPPEREK